MIGWGVRNVRLWVAVLVLLLPCAAEQQRGGPRTPPAAGKFVMDPRGRLSPKEWAAQEEFLEYHARDSAIALYLAILADGDAQGPERELADRLETAEKPAIVLVYFLGEPDRTRALPSARLRERLGPGELARVLERSVMEAQHKVGDFAQLSALCVQFAARAYDLEASLDGTRLTMSRATGQAIPRKAGKRGKIRTQAVSLWEEHRSSLTALGVILAGAFMALALRGMIRLRSVCRIPEADLAPRLGAEYGAGIGSVVSFRDPDESPSGQRQQTRDQLGGI